MGEYATRADGASVKIGTCETMSYLRYEDRKNLFCEPNSLNPATEMNLFWRLPYPDEDSVAIGEYKNWRRGIRLYKMVEYQPQGYTYPEDWEDESLIEEPGRIQLRHEASGLIASVVCYHGMKLPAETAEFRAGWNGKGHSFELIYIKNTSSGVWPVIHCRHCEKMWRCEWDEILEWIPDLVLRERLAKYK